MQSQISLHSQIQKININTGRILWMIHKGPPEKQIRGLLSPVFGLRSKCLLIWFFSRWASIKLTSQNPDGQIIFNRTPWISDDGKGNCQVPNPKEQQIAHPGYPTLPWLNLARIGMRILLSIVVVDKRRSLRFLTEYHVPTRHYPLGQKILQLSIISLQEAPYSHRKLTW